MKHSFIFLFFLGIISTSISAAPDNKNKKNRSSPKVSKAIVEAKPSAPKSKFETIDRVLAVIYHHEGSVPILQSDLRPGIDAIPRTLKDVILEKLMVLDAQTLKVTISDADVDRHLAFVQKEQKLTKEDTIELFKSMGYTFREGMDQLKTKLMIKDVIDYRVRNKVIIDKKDIEDFDNKNPLCTYKVSRAFVPFEDASPALKKIKIEEAIASGEILNLVDWMQPIELSDSDFSEEKAQLKSLEAGSIAMIDETKNGIGLFRMIEKKRTPVEEREREIMNIIGQERFVKEMQNYEKKLLDSSKVKYIDAKK